LRTSFYHRLLADGVCLLTNASRLQTSGVRLQTNVSRLLADGVCLQTIARRLQTFGSRLLTNVSRLLADGVCLQTIARRLQTKVIWLMTKAFVDFECLFGFGSLSNFESPRAVSSRGSRQTFPGAAWGFLTRRTGCPMA
jgi:hypothetical protein